MTKIDWNALGTWAIALLTLLTLWKLNGYAKDTKRMANTAAKQLRAAKDDREATFRPFIAIGWSCDGTKVVTEKLYIRNLGSGVALNISYTRVKSPSEVYHHFLPFLETVPSDEERFVADCKDVIDYQNSRFVVTYESLSGRRYESTVEAGDTPHQNERRELRHSFREVKD